MTILQALVDHYDRLASRHAAPPYGFSSEKISYAILLSRDGQAVDVQSLQDMLGRKLRPSLQAVPQPPPDRTGRKIVPNFLWDKTAYALGAKADSSGAPVLAKREFAAFRTFHEDLLADSEDEGLSALLAFLRSWEPTAYRNLPHAEDMLAANANLVFRLDDEERRFLHERPTARIVWANHLDRGGSDGLCLVTGDRGPIKRLHPVVKGVWGAHSSGARIVSFNENAFESFGKSQGGNAPVSERAAFAYTAALNTLLAHGSRQRIQIGDTTTVFWAEATEPQQSEAAEALFSMFEEPRTDEQEAARVRDKLQAITEGRPLAEAVPDVREDTRFYVLGLAPNAARLSIRFWYAETIGAFAERIVQHWRDLQLEPAPWTSPPPVWRLLYAITPHRKAEKKTEKNQQKAPNKIPPTFAGALMRAILTGRPYPRSLLAAVVARIRVDQYVDASRVAICKAIISRNFRLGTEMEDAPVALQQNSKDIAYNLGRLFAAYAYAENSFAKRSATLRDKYVGAASATPLRVFPILMRGYEHNRTGLAKSGGRKKGAGVRVELAVSQIIALLPGIGELPVSLTLEEQARFFIGFYHQEQAFFAKTDHGEELEQLAEGEE